MTRPHRRAPARTRSLFLLVVIALLFGVEARGQAPLRIVDAAGGGDFTALHTAINGSPDGAVLLVRPGTYSPATATLQAKSLTLIADTGGKVIYEGTLQLRALGPTQRVHVRGMRIRRLDIRDCEGDVWIEDVQGEWALARISPNVSFIRCDFSNPGDTFNSGMTAINAGVTLLDTSAVGQRGFDGEPAAKGDLNFPGSVGEAGLQVRSGSVAFIGGGDFLGGDGGTGVDPNQFACSLGGDGGPGVWVGGGFEFPPDATLLIHATTLAAGVPGLGGLGCAAGAPGLPARVDDGGTLFDFAEPYRGFELSAPVREGEQAVVDVHGQPGDTVLLYYSLVPGRTVLPQFVGSFQLGTPWRFLLSSPVSGDGSLQISLPIPELGPGIQSTPPIFFSAGFLSAQGAKLIGGASFTVLLDQGV